MMAGQSIRQFGRPSSTGNLIDPRRKELIDPPQNAILFVQHAWDAQRGGRPHGWNSRIAAKPHHNIRSRPAHFAARGGHSDGDANGNHDFVQKPALGKGRAGDLFNLHLRRKARRIACAAGIGGQNYPPAPFKHHFCHRLGWEHMPARTTGSQNQKRRIFHFNIHVSRS